MKNPGVLVYPYMLSLICMAFVSITGIQAKDEKMVVSSIVVNAPPKVVYEVIRQYRNNTAARRKQLSVTADGGTVKENMQGVTILGNVECLWQEKDTPYQRVDYHLLSSDKFRSAFGSWLINPANEGRSTQLQLQAYVDAYINIPFKAEITRTNTTKDVKGRLETIKRIAEATATKTVANQADGEKSKE